MIQISRISQMSQMSINSQNLKKNSNMLIIKVDKKTHQPLIFKW